jgi:hypothetical protein
MNTNEKIDFYKVAACYIFLASNDASYITGQTKMLLKNA